MIFVLNVTNITNVTFLIWQGFDNINLTVTANVTNRHFFKSILESAALPPKMMRAMATPPDWLGGSFIFRVVNAVNFHNGKMYRGSSLKLFPRRFRKRAQN